MKCCFCHLAGGTAEDAEAHRPRGQHKLWVCGDSGVTGICRHSGQVPVILSWKLVFQTDSADTEVTPGFSFDLVVRFTT